MTAINGNLGGDLGNLIGGFGGFRDDALENLTKAGAAVAAMVAVANVGPAIPMLGHPAVVPALTVALGVVVGPFIAGLGGGKLFRNLGSGISVGLTIVGGLGVLRAFELTRAYAPALAGAEDALLLRSPLAGARVIAERVTRQGVAGADVRVERVGRGFSGVASVLTTGMS